MFSLYILHKTVRATKMINFRIVFATLVNYNVILLWGVLVGSDRIELCNIQAYHESDAGGDAYSYTQFKAVCIWALQISSILDGEN